MNKMFFQEPTLYKDVETQFLFTQALIFAFARLRAGFFLSEKLPRSDPLSRIPVNTLPDHARFA